MSNHLKSRYGVDLDRVQSSDDVFGLYIGTVEDTDDPIGRCRVRVRVHQIYGQIPTDYLPWAFPSMPPGTFRTPIFGDQVSVLFMCGDVNYPVWFGVIPRSSEAPVNIIRGRDPKLPSSPSNPEKLFPSSIPSSIRNFIAESKGEGFVPYIGQSGSEVQTILTGLKNSFAEKAKNNSSFIDTGDNEVPAEFRNRNTLDPSVSVSFRSRTGHTIVYSDELGDEYLKVIDRAGQEIIFDCPTNPELSRNNKLFRDSKEAAKGTALSPVATSDTGSYRIRIIDASGQEIALNSSVNSHISIKSLSGVEITLDPLHGITVKDSGSSINVNKGAVTINSPVLNLAVGAVVMSPASSPGVISSGSPIHLAAPEIDINAASTVITNAPIISQNSNFENIITGAFKVESKESLITGDVVDVVGSLLPQAPGIVTVSGKIINIKGRVVNIAGALFINGAPYVPGV